MTANHGCPAWPQHLSLSLSDSLSSPAALLSFKRRMKKEGGRGVVVNVPHHQHCTIILHIGHERADMYREKRSKADRTERSKRDGGHDSRGYKWIDSSTPRKACESHRRWPSLPTCLLFKKKARNQALSFRSSHGSDRCSTHHHRVRFFLATECFVNCRSKLVGFWFLPANHREITPAVSHACPSYACVQVSSLSCLTCLLSRNEDAGQSPPAALRKTAKKVVRWTLRSLQDLTLSSLLGRYEDPTATVLHCCFLQWHDSTAGDPQIDWWAALTHAHTHEFCDTYCAGAGKEKQRERESTEILVPQFVCSLGSWLKSGHQASSNRRKKAYQYDTTGRKQHVRTRYSNVYRTLYILMRMHRRRSYVTRNTVDICTANPNAQHAPHVLL